MKTSHHQTSAGDIRFERKDLSIFNIPDTRTRLDTIQKYFFPRFEALLVQTTNLIHEIYGLNPYEQFTINRTPSHRKDAKNNQEDRPYVRVGLGGKRNNQKPLSVLTKSGKPAFHPISRLYYLIEPTGEMSVYLWILGYLDPSKNHQFLSTWQAVIEQNSAMLNKIFLLHNISHSLAYSFLDFHEVLNKSHREILKDDGFFLSSPQYYLPVDFETGLFELQLTFAALYPLLHISIGCDHGERGDLGGMLETYKSWCQGGGSGNWYQRNRSAETIAEHERVQEEIQLDSYHFIRTGLWWEILARDRWTCCSCGRSVQQHGITLHVDHINPRSRGGQDRRENLQTLCMKCNIGKSNRDDTRLTKHSDESS